MSLLTAAGLVLRWAGVSVPCSLAEGPGTVQRSIPGGAFLADVLAQEAGCPAEEKATEPADSQDKRRCWADFMEERLTLLLELSGAPLGTAITEEEEEGEDHMQKYLELQYYNCKKAGHNYFEVSVDLDGYLQGSLAESWQNLKSDARARRQHFGLCAPSACSIEFVATTIYPFVFSTLLIVDLNVGAEMATSMPAPEEGAHLKVQRFQVWPQDEEGLQVLFEGFFHKFDGLSQSLDASADFASYLDINVCWQDYIGHINEFHGLSSLGRGGAVSGSRCIRIGQRLFRAQVLNWCKLPPKLRGELRAAFGYLDGYEWLKQGAPLQLCVPAQCSVAAVRAAVLPFYLHKCLQLIGIHSTAFMQVAAETDFFTSQKSMQLDLLGSWDQVRLEAVLIGNDEKLLKALSSSLESFVSSDNEMPLGQQLHILGPQSAVHKVLGDVSVLHGEELPLFRHISEFADEQAPKVRHIVRTLSCDVAETNPGARESCQARNEARTTPMAFSLQRKRMFVDHLLANDLTKLRRLSYVEELKVILLEPNASSLPFKEGLEAAVRAAVSPKQLLILSESSNTDALKTPLSKALEFIGTHPCQTCASKPKGGHMESSKIQSHSANPTCRTACLRRFAELWAASGASFGSRSGSLSGGVLTERLLSGLASSQAMACSRISDSVFYTLRLANPDNYLRRCYSASGLGRRQLAIRSLRQADRRHLQQIGICLPAECSGKAGLHSLPLWLSGWLSLAVNAPMDLRCPIPRASEVRLALAPASLPLHLPRTRKRLSASEVAGRPKVTSRMWPKSLREALCTADSRRRETETGWPTYTGCSCHSKVLPCADVDVCATFGAANSARSTGRRALVTIHDLQIPFDGVDDRQFRRYIRPAHRLFYEQEGLQVMRQHHGLDHVLLVPQRHLAKYPLNNKIRDELAKKHVRIIEVPWLHPSLKESVVNETNADPQTFGPSEFIRLHLWNLTEYEAVLYLDHDMLLLADVSPLLQCSAATGLYVTTSGNMSPLNMGLHALRPDARVFKAMVEVLSQSEYVPELGFTATPGHKTWGVVDGFGPFRGAAHAGLQGFLYYFFYAPDHVVQATLALHGVYATYAAQVDRCQWNYSKDHLMYKYLTEDNASKPADWESMLFRCRLGSLSHPRIVHKLDEAMQKLLLH